MFSTPIHMYEQSSGKIELVGDKASGCIASSRREPLIGNVQKSSIFCGSCLDIFQKMAWTGQRHFKLQLRGRSQERKREDVEMPGAHGSWQIHPYPSCQSAATLCSQLPTPWSQIRHRLTNPFPCKHSHQKYHHPLSSSQLHGQANSKSLDLSHKLSSDVLLECQVDLTYFKKLPKNWSEYIHKVKKLYARDFETQCLLVLYICIMMGKPNPSMTAERNKHNNQWYTSSAKYFTGEKQNVSKTKVKNVH